MNHYRALAWLRWRLLVNTLRGRGRGTGERLSRLLQVLVPVVLTLLMIPAAAGLGLLGLAGGWTVAAGKAGPGLTLLTARILLGLLTVLVLAWPLVRSSQGAATDLSRLLLLPIPRRALHLGELLSGLTDPWILAFLPGLLLLPAGVLWAGKAAAALTLAAAGVAFAFLLLALGTCSAFLLQLLLRDRRRAEMLALVALVAVSIGGFLPILLDEDLGDGKRDREAAGESRTAGEGGEGEEGAGESRTAGEGGEGEEGAGGPADGRTIPPRLMHFPPWLQAAPSELYGRTLLLALTGGGRVATAWLPLAFLVLEGLAVYGLSLRVHRRLLETPESSGRGRGGPRRVVPIRRLPLLGEAASAVALAQFRTFTRTVKGKLSVFLAPVNVGLIGLLLFRNIDELNRPGFPIDQASLLAFLAAAFGLLGAQPILLNMFATDRAGLTTHFLAPLSDRELVRGKIAGGALLAGLPTLLGAVAALVIGGGGSPLLWPAALLGGLSAYLLFAPAGCLVSALLPKDSDLGSLGSAGNPHSGAALLGFLLTLASLAPPVLLTLLGTFLLGSDVLTLGLVAGWTLVSMAVAWPVTNLAAGVLGERRENLALVAQGR